jgi:cathepsin L
MNRRVHPFLLLAALLPALPLLARNPKQLPAEIHQEVERIKAQLAAQGLDFEVEANPAMQYAVEQVCGRKAELVPAKFSEHEPGKGLNQGVQALATSLPASYLGWCSSVKDQGNCGSCWAFGTIGALEGSYLKTHGAAPIQISGTGAVTVSATAPNLSEQQLDSCNRCSNSQRFLSKA